MSTSDVLRELAAEANGGEVRTVYGWPFARFVDDGVSVVATTGPDARLHRLRAPFDEAAVLLVASLLDASSQTDAGDIAWLLAGFTNWERVDDNAYDVVDDWLKPSCATRHVISLGNDTPRARFVLGRRSSSALAERGEMFAFDFAKRGSATMNRSEGEVTAPPVFASLAQRFGDEAAGRLWRARPEELAWPNPNISRSSAVLMSGGRGPIQSRRVDVGPFTWLEHRQQIGARKFAVAEITVVDGEAHLMRAYELFHEYPGDNVVDPFVLEGALAILLRSVPQSAVALGDVKKLAGLLHLGDVIETEDDARALCAERRTQQHGRRGPYTTTDKGLSQQALDAWFAPYSDGANLGFTHRAANAVGIGANVHGVFSVKMKRLPSVDVDIKRVCDGLSPPAVYIG